MSLALLGSPLMAQGEGAVPPYANTQLADPAREAEARELMHTLRCLTCQSQSIADSDAPMAQAMRHEVRSRMAAGESADEVKAWLIERYGDYVTFDPQVNIATWPLFALPLLFAVIAIMVIARRLRRSRASASEGAET